MNQGVVNMKSEVVGEIFRFAPAGAGTAWYSLTLNQWVGVATVTYIVIQAIYLLRKWWREEKEYAKKEATL